MLYLDPSLHMPFLATAPEVRQRVEADRNLFVVVQPVEWVVRRQEEPMKVHRRLH